MDSFNRTRYLPGPSHRRARGGNVQTDLLEARREFEGEGSVVEVRWHGRVVRSSGGHSPYPLVGKFPTDYIFCASGEVVDMVEAFEEPTTG
jgi:hypothetical protein